MDFHPAQGIADSAPILVILNCASGPDADNPFIAAFGAHMVSLRAKFSNVVLESMQKLDDGNYKKDSFEHALIAVDLTDCLPDLIGQVSGLVKPGCQLSVCCYEPGTADIAKELRLAGLTETSQTVTANWLNARGKKPNYGPGSSAPLKLAAVNGSQPATKMWQLAANDVVDDELIDEDDILTAEDYIKPNQDDLKVSGCSDTPAEGKKRKACKNCTCGLADQEKASNELPQKSSCGSCYLGDAFRCASCPYAGMPPFKQGENVKLAMVDDI